MYVLTVSLSDCTRASMRPSRGAREELGRISLCRSVAVTASVNPLLLNPLGARKPDRDGMIGRWMLLDESIQTGSNRFKLNRTDLGNNVQRQCRRPHQEFPSPIEPGRRLHRTFCWEFRLRRLISLLQTTSSADPLLGLIGRFHAQSGGFMPNRDEEPLFVGRRGKNQFRYVLNHQFRSHSFCDDVQRKSSPQARSGWSVSSVGPSSPRKPRERKRR